MRFPAQLMQKCPGLTKAVAVMRRDGIRFRFSTILFTLLLLLSPLPRLIHAAEQETNKATENELKPAFIYHLFNFTSWPENHESSEKGWQLCVWQGYQGLKEIQVLADEKAAGKKIALNYCRDGVCDTGCHILLLPDGKDKALKTYLHKIGRLPVLTVANAESEHVSESLLYFFSEERRLRMAIDYQATQETGIQMSSRLLRLMRITNKEEKK